MRLSRSSRKKNISRLKLPQLAGIVVISAYGIGQITTPTYALLTNSTVAESSQITTAFVFPGTVDEIADLASKAMNRAVEQREAAKGILSDIRDSGDSQSAEGQLDSIKEAAGLTREASADATALLAQLQSYSIRSQQEVDLQLYEIDQRLSPFGVNFKQLTEAQIGEAQVFEQLLGQAHLTLAEFEEMVRTVSSLRRVDAYVQAAYQQASTAAAQAENYAADTTLFISEATEAIEGLKEAEAKQAKLEAEKKITPEPEEPAVPKPDQSVEPADPAAGTNSDGIIVKIGEKQDVF